RHHQPDLAQQAARDQGRAGLDAHGAAERARLGAVHPSRGADGEPRAAWPFRVRYCGPLAGAESPESAGGVRAAQARPHQLRPVGPCLRALQERGSVALLHGLRPDRRLTMRLLIGGGSRFIGSALTARFRARGDEVTWISRTPGTGRITWQDVERGGISPCDAVINLAGQHILDVRRRWNDAYRNEVLQSRVE